MMEWESVSEGDFQLCAITHWIPAPKMPSNTTLSE